MDEKTMVNDILNNVKASLTTYQNVISETENMQLRQTIQQIRNNDESFEYELFKVAQTKGYYKPAQAASEKEIQTVKNELQWGIRLSHWSSFLKLPKVTDLPKGNVPNGVPMEWSPKGMESILKKEEYGTKKEIILRKYKKTTKISENKLCKKKQLYIK